MYGETHGFGSECFSTSGGYHVSSLCHFIVNSLLNIFLMRTGSDLKDL